MDALELRRQGRHRPARALVARVRLQLDAEAAERLEGVLEHEQLRLDVDAGRPDLGGEPRPADLEAAVLGAECEVAGAADDTVVLAAQGDERHLRSVRLAREGGVEIGAHLVARLRLLDAEPLPGARVARRRPETVLVLGRERLEPHQLALEGGGRPVH